MRVSRGRKRRLMLETPIVRREAVREPRERDANESSADAAATAASCGVRNAGKAETIRSSERSSNKISSSSRKRWTGWMSPG
jgi:hypothetical protein